MSEVTDGISLNLTCASCGGAVTSVEGQRVLACPYCQSLLYVEGDRGVYTVMFRNVLDEPTARARLQAWFDEGMKARDLPEKAVITEVYPIYIPFWRLRARAAGWVCGYRVERHTDRNGHTHTKKVPLEQMVFRDFEWSDIACDPGDIGLRRLPGTFGEVTSHEEGDIPTFEATTSADDAKVEGIESIRRNAISSANVPNITFQKVHVMPKYVGLTFYPVWMCRYTYEGRTYFATLDGVRGGSLSGRAPGDPLYQSLALTGGAVAGGAVAGGALSALMAGIDTEIALVGMAVGFIIFGAAFMFFRHGSEITEGDIDRPGKGMLKKLMRGEI